MKIRVKDEVKEIVGNKIAFDDCHKIYIIEDEEDEEQARSYDYDIYDISMLEEIWNKSCGLRFISNWKLDKRYVNQFEEVEFL